MGVMGCSDDRWESQKEPEHGRAHSAVVKVVSPHTLDCELLGAECTIPRCAPVPSTKALSTGVWTDRGRNERSSWRDRVTLALAALGWGCGPR